MSTRSVRERSLALRGRLHTRRELADRAGVSLDLVRELEQGTRATASVPSPHRLAHALDVTLADLDQRLIKSVSRDLPHAARTRSQRLRGLAGRLGVR